MAATRAALLTIRQMVAGGQEMDLVFLVLATERAPLTGQAVSLVVHP